MTALVLAAAASGTACLWFCDRGHLLRGAVAFAITFRILAELA